MQNLHHGVVVELGLSGRRADKENVLKLRGKGALQDLMPPPAGLAGRNRQGGVEEGRDREERRRGEGRGGEGRGGEGMGGREKGREGERGRVRNRW